MLAPSYQHVTACLLESALHVHQGPRKARFMPCTCPYVNPACVLPGDLLTCEGLEAPMLQWRDMEWVPEPTWGWLGP